MMQGSITGSMILAGGVSIAGQVADGKSPDVWRTGLGVVAGSLVGMGVDRVVPGLGQALAVLVAVVAVTVWGAPVLVRLVDSMKGSG